MERLIGVGGQWSDLVSRCSSGSSCEVMSAEVFFDRASSLWVSKIGSAWMVLAVMILRMQCLHMMQRSCQDSIRDSAVHNQLGSCFDAAVKHQPRETSMHLTCASGSRAARASALREILRGASIFVTLDSKSPFRIILQHFDFFRDHAGLGLSKRTKLVSSSLRESVGVLQCSCSYSDQHRTGVV